MERVTEYFSQLLDVTRENSWVRNEELTFREIDEKEGYIRGTLALHRGYTLYVAGYVHLIQGHPECIKYRYQLQDKKDKLLARWDNAPHYETIATYPHHKHCRDEKIVPSQPMDIFLILSNLDDVLEDKI
jgi:hypothetical protein